MLWALLNLDEVFWNISTTTATARSQVEQKQTDIWEARKVNLFVIDRNRVFFR